MPSCRSATGRARPATRASQPDQRWLFLGRGCPQCAGTGYRRRLGVFEVMEVNDEIQDMIRQRKDSGLLREAAIRGGMKTMFQDGVANAFLGETTLEEVFRVAY
jgi:general secretion pathway protein E